MNHEPEERPGRPGPERSGGGSRFGWAALLPWHAPERQGVTHGWWGWFPNIPRGGVGRAVWTIVVGAVVLCFGALAVACLVGFFSLIADGEPFASLLLGVFAFALMILGFLLFLWHLLAGLALARKEDREAAVRHAEAAEAKARVLEAKKRLLGESDPRP